MTEKELEEKIRAKCTHSCDNPRSGENGEAETVSAEDACLWFEFGIRGDNREIMKLTLSLISENQKGASPFVPERKNLWMKDIIQYAHFCDTMKRVERGESVDTKDLTVGFNPFLLSPDEILTLFRKAGSRNPVKDLLEGIVSFFCSSFVEDEGNGTAETERRLLSEWLDDLWPLLEENREEFVSSGSPDDILRCLQTSVEAFIGDSSTSSLFDRFFAFMKDCIDMYGLTFKDRNPFAEIVRTAFERENSHAFSLSLEEAERRGEEIAFSTYPVRSRDIFYTMVKHGYLVPGTREAMKVYYHYILRYGDMADGEIMRSANHPSYIFESGESPLYAAMRVPEFPREKFVFVAQGQDDMDWVLREAYKLSHSPSINALIAIGADPHRKYSGGDNMFHILLRDEGAEIVSILRLAPPECLTEKNGEGKTPLDCYFEREMKDSDSV